MDVWRPGAAPYPESLARLAEPPRVLYAQGDAATIDRPVVAVVGTRRATPYGERVARGISTALARAGVCVVSGLALGIDTVAHQAVLGVGGATCAVLGTGLDIHYPASHARIQAAIAERGLVLTEYELGTPARRWSFPQRNRVIAGLARAVIVVEAGRASGALGTAVFADQMGRAVAAVPGPIDASQSQGTNGLIRDGAIAITDVTDVLLLAGVVGKGKGVPTLSGDEATVWKALGTGRIDADVLAARSRLPTSRCLAALTALELAGLVTGELDGTYGRA
ncbi:MAG TPA: DNA-processing protein DprA [Gemmatimonadaceae bacterium]|nr:DNA-processing protein DprA [Gemmatimonadaceae bacterium]